MAARCNRWPAVALQPTEKRTTMALLTFLYKNGLWISWPFFGKNGEHWYGLIFLVEQFSGTPFTQNPEGDLCWVDIDKIMDLPMWDGDRHFLPLVFDDDPRAFHGVMPYQNGQMKSWSYSRI
jgi:8-oxo-dGTP diphosphatase